MKVALVVAVVIEEQVEKDILVVEAGVPLRTVQILLIKALMEVTGEHMAAGVVLVSLALQVL